MALSVHNRRAGFTLVELMIAMLAGAFAVGGVYYLNGVSSRTFSEQMRISETQMSLRSAMEQLRRELARAGYLFTPSSRVNLDCTGSFATGGTGPGGRDAIAPRALRAIRVIGDGSPQAAKDLLAAPNKTRADRVDVWGNYATSDAYLADPTATTISTIRFQTDSESFRRSFFNRATAAIDTARFTQTFAPGRMLRIEGEGRVYFRDIAAVQTSPNFEVTVDPLPSCFEPTRWSAVAPIVQYRYGLEVATPGGDLARLLPTTAAVGSSRAMLVRREVDAAGDLVPGSARVVLDNAVEFAADAMVDANTDMDDPPAVPGTSADPPWVLVRGAALDNQSTNRPWSLRSLIVTLSARSAEADPRLPSIERKTFGSSTLLDTPLMTFRLVGGGVPAGLNARVRTMRSEIFLQNL